MSQVLLARCIGYLCWLFSWMTDMMKYLEILRSRILSRTQLVLHRFQVQFSKQVLIFRGSILHIVRPRHANSPHLKLIPWFYEIMLFWIFLQGCRCMFMDDYCLYCFVYIVRLVSEMHFPKQPHPNRSQARFWLGFGDSDLGPNFRIHPLGNGNHSATVVLQ